MASITVEIRERKAALRDVARALKIIVTAVAAVQRLISLLIARKQALPDEKDLVRLLALLSAVVKGVSAVGTLPSKLQEVWRL